VSHNGEQHALLSCDVSSDGLTVAAGTELRQDDALIVYWCALPVPFQSRPVRSFSRDPRYPAAPLRKHTSTHSDDITSMHFSRSSSAEQHSRDLLLSGSTDGLVCISDARESDEDEAVLYVGNLGSSISQAGWVPRRSPRAGGAWAATDMETFSLWSDEVRTATAVIRKKRGFSDRVQLDLKNDLDIRAPSVHTQARTWVTDYLIGCHESEESGLSVLVGSNEYAFLHSPSSNSHALPKGRYRAAQECGLPRSRIALVFRTVMDRSS